jgi:hypothetical protein
MLGKEGERRLREGGGELVIRTSTPWNAEGSVAAALAASNEVGSLAEAKRGLESRDSIPALVMTGANAS